VSKVGKVADYTEGGRSRSQRIGVANQGQQLGAGRWAPKGPEGVVGHAKGNYFGTTGTKRKNKSFHISQMELTKSPFTAHKRNNKDPLIQM
jgi:hypothetical protein